MLKESFHPISLNDAIRFSKEKDYYFNASKPPILFSFDDGLSDHYLAAKILAENNISAVFYMPSCFMTDRLPANPTIIHYTLAEFGISGFLDFYLKALEENKVDIDSHDIKFEKGKDRVWDVIEKIKNSFKYKFDIETGRKILLHIYQNGLLTKYPDALSIMHLSDKQINDIINMGHQIGAHTHNHISINPNILQHENLSTELIDPKRLIEKRFNTKVKSLSYPFGSEKDILSVNQLIENTNAYDLAFTTEKKVNNKKTSPYLLGRYEVMSKESDVILCENLKSLYSKIN
jgi:peptidoglycan/xylan/chitin deacetylase (PgdA/CDA1 family)